jgi:MSHA biogenesis protein MshP
MTLRRQKGVLVMAAIFLLVVVGAFVAYITTQANVQHATTISDLNSARAMQAARAGIDWSAFQVLQGGANCAGVATTLNLGATLADFHATVSCASNSLTEGGSTVVVYQLTSTGCNRATCPAAGTPGADYVERQLVLTIAQ